MIQFVISFEIEEGKNPKMFVQVADSSRQSNDLLEALATTIRQKGPPTGLTERFPGVKTPLWILELFFYATSKVGFESTIEEGESLVWGRFILIEMTVPIGDNWFVKLITGRK